MCMINVTNIDVWSKYQVNWQNDLPMLLQFDKCRFAGRRRCATIQILWSVRRIWRIHDTRMRCARGALVRAPQICEV